MVNYRRKFFHVTLNEIKAVIKQNFDKTVEFIDVPDAEQYRISKKIKTCCLDLTIACTNSLRKIFNYHKRG